MNKKVSLILLCILAVLLVATVVLGVQFGKSIAEIQVIEPSEDSLPGAALLGAAFTYVALWIGYAVGAFLLSCAGVIASGINVKISTDGVIKRISTAAFAFFSVLAILAVLSLVYLFVSVF